MNKVDVVSLVIRGPDVSLILEPALDKDPRRAGDVLAKDPLVLDANGLPGLPLEVRVVLQGHDLHILRPLSGVQGPLSRFTMLVQ